ncbi:MAG: hypothetical protein ACRDA1_11375, partial [Plesiomonas shigelloides]
SKLTLFSSINMPSSVDVNYGEGAYALRMQRHPHVLKTPHHQDGLLTQQCLAKKRLTKQFSIKVFSMKWLLCR